MEKAVTCVAESEKTSLWTSAKLKRLFPEHLPTELALFRATNSLPQKTHYEFASFPSLLFKSKQNKQKWRNKESWIRTSFLNVCWCYLPKIIRACRNHSLPNLVHFSRHRVYLIYWSSCCMCRLGPRPTPTVGFLDFGVFGGTDMSVRE